MNRTTVFHFSCTTLVCLVLCACGGGGGGSSGTATPGVGATAVTLLKGKLIDSAVSGVTYTVTTTDGKTIKGVTDESGTFEYQAGETVTFSIGSIVLPSALGDATVTPVSMASGGDGPVASNVAYFLQSLDFDLDPSNGISVDPRVLTLSSMAAFSGQQIDWTQATASFIANSKLRALWNQAKELNPANVVVPPIPPKTPEETDKHLAETLFGSLDTQSPQTEGCALTSGIEKPSITVLSTNLWADLMAKPKSTAAPGWIYDGEITQGIAVSEPPGDLRIYKATPASPEYKAALKSVDVDNLDADLWFKHQGDPNVVLRIAAKERLGGDSIYFPKYSGSAIYLHYVATDNSVLQFQFATGLQAMAFFSFLGNNTHIFYRGTAGKDGVIDSGGEDGFNTWSQERGDNWVRHLPASPGKPADPIFNLPAVPAKAADPNFPPNLRKGGTTPTGRALGTTTCILKPGGSVLLWRKPSTSSDLFFSPLALRNNVGELAPVYSDAKGYKGFAGIRAGVKMLRVLK